MDRCVLLTSTPEWVVSPRRAITKYTYHIYHIHCNETIYQGLNLYFFLIASDGFHLNYLRVTDIVMELVRNAMWDTLNIIQSEKN